MKNKNIYFRILSIICLILFCPLISNAQSMESFEEFRSGIMDKFDSFKSRILEHYADFLAGEWHEYESLEAESKFASPKLDSMPAFDTMEVEEGDSQHKELMVGMRFHERPMMGVDIPMLVNHIQGNLADRKGNDGMIMTGHGLVDATDEEVFRFYGMRFSLPKVEFCLRDTLTGTLDFSRQWERLTADSVAKRINPHILALQKKTGISDYLMFEMIFSYLDNKFPSANDASKMSATHYLLANMGFGVRIAIDDNENPYILLPFTEKIFGKSRIPLSKTYYVFSTPGRPEVKRVGLRSPYVPDNAEQGKDLALRMDGMNLPVKRYHYDISYDDIRLEGDLNENIFPMLYRYPQMDTGGFAASVISKDVRDDVVDQLKRQLENVEPMKAADKLLSMIQFGFPYATDDNFHGFEKPYFFEEMLYYPKSDCEDRAVFFSYLLWNVLGLENDLITYPNHEATAIKADKVWGGFDHYVKSGMKYFISDPTYQGAPTGQCMPQYVGMEPGIDFSYQ